MTLLKPSDSPVRHLWRVSITSISHNPTKTRGHQVAWNIISRTQFDEIQVVSEARNKFQAGWWEEHLIVAVEYVGEVQVIDGIPL